MSKLVIVTHGRMASGMKSSIDLFFPDAAHVVAVDAYVDERNVWNEIEAVMETTEDAEQIILMSDFLGGSVNQKLISYLSRSNVFLISGINLPLLLELAADPSRYWDKDSLNLLVQEAQKAMQLILSETNEETEEFF